MDSPLILDSKRASSFSNPVFKVSMDAESIQIAADGATTSFMEMAAGRNDQSKNLASSAESVLNKLSDRQGLHVNNIGVSLALTTRINGSQYAILAHRPQDNRHMLLSGYVDAGAFEQASLSARGLIEANALKEGGEEFLLTQQEGKVCTGEVFGSIAQDVAREFVIGKGGSLIYSREGLGVTLGKPYDALSYDDTRPVSFMHSSMPGYIKNVHPAGMMTIDEQPLNAGFQYAQQWNAGQIIIPFEVSIPSLDSLYLFHAEDRMNPDVPGELITMLHREGLVLIKLDDQERLSSECFSLRDGTLHQRTTDDPAKRVFSEAFAPSPIEGVTGFVKQKDILYGDMNSDIRA